MYGEMSAYIRMPVQLPQCSGLQRHNRGRNRLANREVSGVNDTDRPPPASGLLHSLLARMERIARIARQLAKRMVDLSITNRRIQDIRIRRRSLLKHTSIHSKALRKDVLGRMCDPVVDIEGGAYGIEVAVVKGKEVFVLFLETLDGMRFALGEVPDVALAETVDLVATFFVHSGDDDFAFVHESPFGLYVNTLARQRSRGVRQSGNIPHDASATPLLPPSSDAAARTRCHDSTADR